MDFRLLLGMLFMTLAQFVGADEMSGSSEASSAGGEPVKVVNSASVQKRKARAEAKAKFEDENGASFDAYGRVIRYGTSADELACDEKSDKKGSKWWSCRVTDYSRRKYLTKEEKIVSKMLVADKQEELDSGFGSTGAEGAAKKHKFKKEQKARCRVFEEWLAEYKKDESPNHKAFFAGYLKKNYEDFAAYRGVAESGGGGKKGIKKAKKLKRHISLNVHQDKLPVGCASDEMKEMMTAIMAHLEEVEACIETPHKCDPRDL